MAANGNQVVNQPNFLLPGDVLLKLSNKTFTHKLISTGQSLAEMAKGASEIVHAALVTTLDESDPLPTVATVCEMSGDGAGAFHMKEATLFPDQGINVDLNVKSSFTSEGDRWVLYRMTTPLDETFLRFRTCSMHQLAEAFHSVYSKVNFWYSPNVTSEVIANAQIELSNLKSKCSLACSVLMRQKNWSKEQLDIELIKAAPIIVLRDLVADLANGLVFGDKKEFDEEVRTGSYSKSKAFWSIIRTTKRSAGMTDFQKKHFQEQWSLNTSEFENEFFCSHFVIYVYGLAAQLMHPNSHDSTIPTIFPIDKNVTSTSPGELYLYLNQAPGWVTIEPGRRATPIINSPQMNRINNNGNDANDRGNNNVHEASGSQASVSEVVQQGTVREPRQHANAHRSWKCTIL